MSGGSGHVTRYAAVAAGTLFAAYLYESPRRNDHKKSIYSDREVTRQLPSFSLFGSPVQCFFWGKTNEKEEGGGENNASSKLSGSTAVKPRTSLTRHSSVSEGEFADDYILGKLLGSGAFANVWSCNNRKTKCIAAVKIFDLKMHKTHVARVKVQDGIREEVEILRSVAHPHIVKAYDLYEEEDKIYLVMELCHGGELFDRIVAKTQYNEREARDVIRTLLDSVAYCHEKKVVHRDLKPENLLLSSPECDLDIKLADFGAAARFDKPNSLSRYCGTPGYTAPEILQGKKYGTAVDCWSIGIIAYILLGGYPPFADNEDQLSKKCAYEFHSPEWDEVSDDAKDLIRGLLHVDPRGRLTAQDALNHEWIVAQDNLLEIRRLDTARKSLEKFNARRKFKAAVGAVIATNKMQRALGGLGGVVLHDEGKGAADKK